MQEDDGYTGEDRARRGSRPFGPGWRSRGRGAFGSGGLGSGLGGGLFDPGKIDRVLREIGSLLEEAEGQFRDRFGGEEGSAGRRSPAGRAPRGGGGGYPGGPGGAGGPGGPGGSSGPGRDAPHAGAGAPGGDGSGAGDPDGAGPRGGAAETAPGAAAGRPASPAREADDGYADEDGSRAASLRGRGPKGYRRSDERLTELVSDALLDDERLDASDLEVSVTDGEVTLAGTVATRRGKHHAENVAARVAGTPDVDNRLRVGPPEASDPLAGGPGSRAGAASAGAEADSSPGASSSAPGSTPGSASGSASERSAGGTAGGGAGGAPGGVPGDARRDADDYGHP